jgi:uncharacterized repeat protein (TIGR01451 family)
MEIKNNVKWFIRLSLVCVLLFIIGNHWSGAAQANEISSTNLFIDSNRVGPTDVSGPITENTTWNTAGSPYRVTGDVTVNYGVTLTIDPGVVVKFNTGGYRKLIVDGTLTAVGTTGNPIIFTSLDDNTHGGTTTGSDGNPEPGDWGGIIFNAGSTGSTLAHTSIFYGGSFVYPHAPVDLLTSDVDVHDNTIQWSKYVGLRITSSDGINPFQIQANTFISNTDWAMYAMLDNEDVDLIMEGNTSTGSTYNGLGIEGTISGTVTYSNTGTFPFIINKEITVREDAELTIPPGTVMKFRTDAWYEDLVVNGSLIAQGTAADPIIFTSLDDDAHGGVTRGNNVTSDPVAGDWGALVFNATSHDNVLEHTWIGYGGSFVSLTAVELFTSDIIFQNNTIYKSGNTGVGISGVKNGKALELSNNTFVDAGTWACYVDVNPTNVDLIFTNNTSTGAAYNGCRMPVGISGQVTFQTDENLPFIVLSDVTVQAGAELTISPGAVVKFEGIHDNLIINGSLIAQGTQSNPLTFEHLVDSWGAIMFNAGSTGNILEYAYIGYGGWARPAQVAIYTDDVDISHNILTGAHTGVYIENADPNVEKNVITSNDNGIRTAQDANPTILENAIYENTNYGLNNENPNQTVDAAYNYWGDASGPYHETDNPFAEGDTVNDKVLFTPWLEYPPLGTMTLPDILLTVSSGTWFHPGEIAHIRIRYANMMTRTVENAVVLLSLPDGSNYLDSDPEGIFWPYRHQVFWKLGDLTPGTSGEMTVKVQYQWGIPDGAQDAAIGMVIGSNMYNEDMDVNEYLNYTPITIEVRTTLTQAEVDAELAAHADMNTLYNQAINQGYVFGVAERLNLSTTDTVIQFVLIHPQNSAFMFLRRIDDEVIARIYDSTYFTEMDTTGSMSIDMYANTVTYSGDWDASQGYTICGLLTKGRCLYNCLKYHAPGWFVSNTFKSVSLLGNVDSCYQCKISGGEDKDNCDKCALWIGGVEGGGEMVDSKKCVTDCNERSDSWICSKDKVYCWKSLKNIYYDLGIPNFTTDRCVDGQYHPVPETRVCPYGTRCVDGRGCVDCANGNVDCHRNNYNLAHDPNEKFGPQGNLLPGQTVTYKITYENEGSGAAQGVFIVDELSENFDDSTLTIYEGGKYYAGSRILSWYIGDLPPQGEIGSTGAVSFTVKLKDGLPEGTVIENQATVHFPSVPEITPTNLIVNAIESVVATPQDLEAESGQPLNITLKGKELTRSPLTYSVVDEPRYGTLSGTAPNLVYTSMDGFTGMDYFTFKASTGASDSEPAYVSIMVTPWSGDTTPPEILWTYPADGQELSGVSETPVFTDTHGPAYGPSIRIQFSEAIDASTLTRDSVQVKVDGGGVISTTVTFDGTSNQGIILPREPLDADANYTATVKKSVADLIGNTMAADVTWQFGSGISTYRIFLPAILR